VREGGLLRLARRRRAVDVDGAAAAGEQAHRGRLATDPGRRLGAAGARADGVVAVPGEVSGCLHDHTAPVAPG
jgi:hypothetical protein